MVVFEFKGKNIYMDNRLARSLDKLFINLQKEDRDVVFIIDGKERSGKSKFADMLCGYASIKMKSYYGLDSICMTPDEFRKRVQLAKKNECITYDEAHRGMGSRSAMSEINKLLIDLMMEMGQRNLFMVIVLPTFFMLDRYQALHRAKGLFHIYERRGQRGFWCYFNEKNKAKLFILGKKLLNYNVMKWPFFRGRFYDQWCVEKANYNLKKKRSFEIQPRQTRSEKYIHQRNCLLWGLWNETKLKTQKSFLEVLKKYRMPLKKVQLSEIIKEMQTFFAKLEEPDEKLEETIQSNEYEGTEQGLATENL